MTNFAYKLLAAAALVAAAAPVAAAPVIFFGEDINTLGDPNEAPLTNANAARASFFSNLVGVGTETFEGIAVGTAAPIAVSFGAAGTATINNGVVSSGNNGVGRYPISGSNYLDAGSNNFSIGFSAPIAAFGFYATDVGDFGGGLTLTLTSSLGVVSVLNVGNSTSPNGEISGSNFYYGFYDTVNSYTSITFGNGAAGTDFFGFDDFSVGSLQQVQPGVPEPATWALMIGGFGFVGVAARRRRVASVAA